MVKRIAAAAPRTTKGMIADDRDLFLGTGAVATVFGVGARLEVTGDPADASPGIVITPELQP
jgi:hypothetical protein